MKYCGIVSRLFMLFWKFAQPNISIGLIKSQDCLATSPCRLRSSRWSKKCSFFVLPSSDYFAMLILFIYLFKNLRKQKGRRRALSHRLLSLWLLGPSLARLKRLYNISWTKSKPWLVNLKTRGLLLEYVWFCPGHLHLISITSLFGRIYVQAETDKAALQPILGNRHRSVDLSSILKMILIYCL